MIATLKILPQADRIRLSGDIDPADLRRAALHSAPQIDQLASTAFPSGSLGATVRIGAWNVQQGHFPTEARALLSGQNLDIALLTELDIGLGRTGQRNIVQDLAEAQGHGAIYGPEFLELYSAADDDAGWHCNAITAAVAPRDVRQIRLPDEADWLIAPRRGQRRFGGRMAIASRFALGHKSLVVCVLHLESDTDARGRARQMDYLSEVLEEFAAGDPILIGGDLNAGARTADLNHEAESLFGSLQDRGFRRKGFNQPGPTSRHSRVQNAVQQNRARFDWFLGRGLTASNPTTIAAVDAQGNAISDHDLIAVTVELK